MKKLLPLLALSALSYFNANAQDAAKTDKQDSVKTKHSKMQTLLHDALQHTDLQTYPRLVQQTHNERIDPKHHLKLIDVSYTYKGGLVNSKSGSQETEFEITVNSKDPEKVTFASIRHSFVDTTKSLNGNTIWEKHYEIKKDKHGLFHLFIEGLESKKNAPSDLIWIDKEELGKTSSLAGSVQILGKLTGPNM